MSVRGWVWVTATILPTALGRPVRGLGALPAAGRLAARRREGVQREPAAHEAGGGCGEQRPAEHRGAGVAHLLRRDDRPHARGREHDDHERGGRAERALREVAGVHPHEARAERHDEGEHDGDEEGHPAMVPGLSDLND